MIRTKLAYDGSEMFINPYTVSYIINQDYETVVGFTNGHTYSVSASASELRRLIINETKSLCKECTKGVQE